jgi:hypothetical protein
MQSEFIYFLDGIVILHIWRSFMADKTLSSIRIITATSEVIVAYFKVMSEEREKNNENSVWISDLRYEIRIRE